MTALTQQPKHSVPGHLLSKAQLNTDLLVQLKLQRVGEDALKVLATGQPLVCSIRFKEDEQRGRL